MRWLVIALVACSSGDPKPRDPAPTPRAIDALAAVPAPGLRLPAGVRPVRYDVRLELDPGREQFAGQVEIRVQLDAPVSTIWLHAEVDVERVTIDGNPATIAPPTEHELRAIELAAPARGEVTLSIAYTGKVGDALEGVFRQKFAGKWFLYTQSEATYARRIVPCFDEPHLEAPWHVTLVVPEGQVALANAPVASERSVDGKRREITFAEMPALPPHLLAFAVGPFALVELGKLGRAAVPVRLAVAPHHAKRTGAARTWVPKVLDALETYLDQPLPLAKLDLVAVPRFFGAMENPGLVTFEVTALLGDDKDPAFLRRHTRFLAHELAHQWLGNAVTPAWWDDLWIAEAFATWLDDKLSRVLGTLDDPALRTQLARAHALAADREVKAQPLRRAIASNADIEDAFDAISYEKGAAVIAMFEEFVGEARFQAVVRSFVRGRTSATASDFVAEFAKVDPLLAKAFAGYLERAGAPVVDLAIDCAGKRVEVAPRDGTTVPVCVRHPAGKACVLASGKTAIALDGCPAWVVGNADGRGYYHVHGPTRAGIEHLTAAERLAHGEDRAAAIARGDLAHDAALAEVDALLATRDPYAELAAIAMLAEANRRVGEGSLATWSTQLHGRLGKRLSRTAIWSPRGPIEHAIRDRVVELVPPDKAPRDVAQRARAVVERALKETPAAMYTAELQVAIAFAAPTGGKALFDRIADAAAKQAMFADEWLEGLGQFDASFAPRAVELVLDERFEPDHAFAAIERMFARTPTRAAAWRATQARLAQLIAALGATEAARLVDATASLCDRATRAEVEAALRPRVATIAGGTRALDDALVAIERCAR